ncbi:MAG TPA: DUF3108 domain-containing protein [Longimicrobiales bacterium]|nr:DUF3108 domain-containing protein [Longimicrobiales bacterium]
MKTTTATVFMLLALAPGLSAQRQVAMTAPSSPAAVAAVPFGPGERLVYDVNAGWLGKRGSAWSEVTGVETVRGRQTYQLNFRVRGGMFGANIDDRQASWLDVGQLYSHRFFQDLDQPRYQRVRTIDFFPGDGVWRQKLCAPQNTCTDKKQESGALATNLPLDDVSFMFWARTLPLEVGRRYEFNRYYKDEGNPVVIEVLRRERVTVPFGTFNTIVVRPLIRTKGLFGEGGEAEIYFTDDERRLIVLLKTSMPLIGKLEMKLQSYTPGSPLGVR